MKAKINNKNSANSKSKGTDKLTKTKTKLGSNQKNNFKPIKGKSAQLKNKHLKNYLDSQSHFLNDLRVITPSKAQQEEKLKEKKLKQAKQIEEYENNQNQFDSLLDAFGGFTTN